MSTKLVPDSISHDVVAATLQLLEGAHTGEIVGLAFVVMLKGREFYTNLAGACRDDPHLTRGMVASLDDEIFALIAKERHDKETGSGDL